MSSAAPPASSRLVAPRSTGGGGGSSQPPSPSAASGAGSGSSAASFSSRSNAGGARKPSLQLNPNLTSTLRSQQQLHADDSPVRSPGFGLSSGGGGSSASEMDERLQVLERTCHRLVSIVGSSSASGSPAAAASPRSSTSASASASAAASLAAQVAALETKLAASLASSAEQRIELDQAREAQAAAEEKLAARLRNLETRIERESLHSKMNHSAAAATAAGQTGKDGGTATASAASAAAAESDSTQSRLDALDTDIDNLYALLADKFSGLHSALGAERTARARFETDLRKFVLTFQTEFRGIVNALQTSMKAAHSGVEKVVRREIEARQDGARAAAESLALAAQTSSKEQAQLRSEMQKQVAELNGRITRIMEQSRTAAAQSSLALQRAEQAALDATQAKDRATTAAARASAQLNGNSAAAATASSPSRNGGLLPSIPSGSASSAAASSASSSSSSIAAVRNNAVPALSASSSSSAAGGPHARKLSSSVRESSPEKHRKNSSSISQQQQSSAQIVSPSGKSAAASSSSSNSSSSAAAATAASMRSQIKLPAKPAAAASSSPASSSVSSAAPTAAASSYPAATSSSSSSSAATAAASSTPAVPASSTSGGASSIVSATTATATEREAAIRIQSVYRGWSVRHTQALERAAPSMPRCARCGDKAAVKRCEQCSAAASGNSGTGVFCQHCEQELHASPETRKHKRRYLLEELNKSRSLRLGASGIVSTTPSSSPPSTASAASVKPAARPSAASSAASASVSSASFVAPVSPFLRGDVLLSSLDCLVPEPCASDPALVGQVVAVAAGLAHAAIVTAEGRVYMHGDNSCGQLGLGEGDRSHRAEPTLLESLPSPVLQVSASHEHTLFRLADGSVWSCGSGMLGRLGTESDADAEAPQRVPLPPPATAISIATGQYNSGFILAPAAGSGGANRVFISGANAQGQCGLGHLTPQLTPALVTFPDGVSVIKLAFGDKHTVALSSAGEVWSWGSNEFGQGGEPVSTKDSAHQLTPQRIAFFTAMKLHAIDIACGERHTHVLVRAADDSGNAQLYSFGSGEEHLMGVFDNVDQFRPVLVDLPAAGATGQCVSIATGQGLSMATLDSGDVLGWGFALESPTPKQMVALRGSSVQQVAVGSSANLLVHLGPAQEVTHWLFESAEAPEPFEELRGRRLKDISVGSTHYAAIDAAGKLLVWGSNSDFQLGTGNALDMPLPVTISLPVALRSVVCAAMHSLALAADGSVWSWGSGMSGRCGIGGDGDVVRPTMLSALKEQQGAMESIAIGQYNGGAVSTGGLAFVWGSNDGAQLGLGDFTPRLLPVQLPLRAKAGSATPPRVVSLSFGNKHAAAVCADGTAFSWGSNDFGQLGIGEIDVPGAVNEDDGLPLQHAPAIVASLAQTPLARVVCGENTTFFIGRNRGLYACGSAETNQLGAGASAEGDGGDQSLPLPIAAFASLRVRSLSVGNLNCAAVVEPKGTTWVWGWALGEEPRVLEALSESDVKIVACGLTDLVCST